MEPTTAVASSNVLSPIIYFLFGCILKKIDKMNECKSVSIVIPPGSGKSEFLKTYLTEFNILNNDLYFIDVEDVMLKEMDDVEKSKLDILKQKDVLMYQSKLFKGCKLYLNNVIQHLKETKQKKTIIVLVSSIELKKYLGIKECFLYAPSKKLYDKIKTNNPNIVQYLDYTRKLLENNKKTFVYATFEQLFIQILNDLKIKRTL